MTYRMTLLLHKYWKWLTKGRSMNSRVMTEVVSVLTINKCFKGDSMEMCFVQRRLMCWGPVIKMENLSYCSFFGLYHFFFLFYIKESKNAIYKYVFSKFWRVLKKWEKILDDVFPVDFLSSLDERYARWAFQIFWSLRRT